MKYFSWGRIKSSEAQEIQFPDSLKNHLIVGSRRSYGDSCLNSENFILDNLRHNRIISFDPSKGEITAESGATISQIINEIAPAGYFFEVVPGTKHVTIGGAVANDVHGKNHEQYGSFGNTIIEFSLMRDQEEFICSTTQNTELFHATIGGLGLTGYIKWIKIRLRKHKTLFLKSKNLAFNSVAEMVSLFELQCEYKVAWIDVAGKGDQFRGILHVANHADSTDQETKKIFSTRLPFHLLGPLISKSFFSIYNFIYFYKNRFKSQEYLADFNSFFFPLDRYLNWNEIYPDGFYQIQIQIPKEQILQIQSLLARFKETDEIPTLVILKKFGNMMPLGLLSFPTEGYTLAIDLPNRGTSTQIFILSFYDEALRLGGKIYPCKDQIMNSFQFIKSYPNVQKFIQYKLKEINSDLWRRVEKNLK